ncbi:hypothetical protein M8818_004655 [Zalaria obscura]|uniref:Uncharacterized protein n=1 Tax=Zalaria obscura TaxID=2024903 RepID=A0ACC3SBR9_9PEZI
MVAAAHADAWPGRFYVLCPDPALNSVSKQFDRSLFATACYLCLASNVVPAILGSHCMSHHAVIPVLACWSVLMLQAANCSKLNVNLASFAGSTETLGGVRFGLRFGATIPHPAGDPVPPIAA